MVYPKSRLCNHHSARKWCMLLVHSTGDVKHAGDWQDVLEQIITQLVPPMAPQKLPPTSMLSSPDHASSVDMVISPPPVPPASHHSPHQRTSPARMQQRQSPARSSGSAGRSPASNSPRLLPLSGRVQKRTSSALRPRWAPVATPGLVTHGAVASALPCAAIDLPYYVSLKRDGLCMHHLLFQCHTQQQQQHATAAAKCR